MWHATSVAPVSVTQGGVYLRRTSLHMVQYFLPTWRSFCTKQLLKAATKSLQYECRMVMGNGYAYLVTGYLSQKIAWRNLQLQQTSTTYMHYNMSNSLANLTLVYCFVQTL